MPLPAKLLLILAIVALCSVAAYFAGAPTCADLRGIENCPAVAGEVRP